MAHPDVVIDHPAMTEPLDRPDDPLGRQIIHVVIRRRDPQAMLADHRVVQRKHAPRSVTAQAADRHARLRRHRPQHGRQRLEPRRDQADEHPVNVTRIDPVGVGGQSEPAIQCIEIERDHRVGRRPDRIIPQSHIPEARRSGRITSLDRQRRTVDRIEPRQPDRLPLKAQHAPRIIARRLAGMRRMREPVRAFEDQPDQIPLAQKAERDRQAMLVGGRHHTGHRSARKIDCPV